MEKELTLQVILPVRNDPRSRKKAIEAKKYYEARGFKVITPFDIASSVEDIEGHHHEGKIQASCLYFLSDADLAVILPVWEYSQGCINEIIFATTHGIPLYFYRSNIRVFFNTKASVEIESQRPGELIDASTILNQKEVRHGK